MKIRLILFFYFFLSQTLVFAQTIVSGTVLDEKSKPLPGVNIFIKGSFDGASSDAEGEFTFETGESGEQILVCTMMGFESQEISVQLSGAQLRLQSLILREEFNELNAVTISAGAMEASDEKKSVILRPLDIVTTPSANGDIIGAFQTLPGTSTVGNDGRLFVRGGDASEVGIYIDGLKVANSYGTTAANVPTRNRFNPNLFKGTFFSTGGYSAEYGQALSSALAMNTKDVAARSQGDLSVLSVGAGYSHTLANDKQSISLSGNILDLTPYQALVKQNFEWERAPHGWDLELAAQSKLSKGGMLKVLARTEAGGMEVWQALPGIDGKGVLVNLKNRYSYAQTNWRKAYDKGWTLFAGASFSHNKDQIRYDSAEIDRSNDLSHLKLTAVKDFSGRVSAKNGAELFVHSYAENLVRSQLSRSFEDQETYLFTEWDWYLSRKFVLRGGLRTGYSSLAEKGWLDPRASLAYQVSENGTLSLAAGRFHQLPVDNFRVLNPNLQNSQAKHLILNYLLQKDGLTFRAETFYKSYDKLVVFQGNPQSPSLLQNGGEGYAQGFDVFFRDRKSLKNTDYWITYSFVDSKRSYNQYQAQVRPDFAPKHNFSVVVKHFVSSLKSQIGASFSFNDGYAYTNPNLPGEMNSKTDAYQNLSLSWSYLPKPNLIVHAAVTNVMGADNIFGYTYTARPDETGQYGSLPIEQSAPRFIVVGVFLTLSKDKNANMLNNL
ncbi:TonB-dependent receptor [Algoriphagus aestuariicola]|uniref:TonB-dependent receptor n=1 Tax=Algoriphagus aestuariicola TaxID=1852016 RepID=A0ABS3BTD2_9BACT|nr:TonB-dependent receptor [Algoriphagus aestuariicola]MBN7802496.1 TonB-dependent receptor [Algoriphagus aestuariicola]